MNILICGDSFAADYSFDELKLNGWPNLLSKQYNVTNLAQCGISEYKILKQIKSVDKSCFDFAIICHTSTGRVHIKEHPLHKDKTLHSNCDLILNDLENNRKNKITRTAINYFKYIFDDEYYNDIYDLFVKEIKTQCSSLRTLHITFFEYPNVDINFFEVFKRHRGQINHLSAEGNLLVFNSINKFIQNET